MSKTKKILSVVLSLIFVICFACTFVGCGEDDAEKAEEGQFYRLSTAYEYNWLDENELKSIACAYYEWGDFGENPYKGMYISTEELSKETENKMLEVFGNGTEVKVFKYLGTYDGNIVAAIGGEFIEWGSPNGQVGGVSFPYAWKLIYVYHIFNEKPEIEITGKLYWIGRAYERGFIDSEVLKSVSCRYYELHPELENPYSGLYTKPTETLSKAVVNELKQAYLEQIDKCPDQALDWVSIDYIGTYNKKMVFSMRSEYVCNYPGGEPNMQIGGVTFYEYSWANLYVYIKFTDLKDYL